MTGDAAITSLARSRERIQADPFAALRAIAARLALDEDVEDSDSFLEIRDAIIRATEHRDVMGSALAIHDSLLAQIGMFPYMAHDSLSGRELFELEVHRPLDGDGNLVWHREQSEVYTRLMDGQNVILSAPTSFGKSRIIDSLIQSEKFSNVVVVVPTLALIDETRRRIARLETSHRVVTHTGQATSDRNVLVLTQERLLDFGELPEINLFVIDEFYKLSIDGTEDDSRARILNIAFHKLLATGAQYYLLGPNVREISEEALKKLDAIWIDSKDATVAVDIEKVPAGATQKERLVTLCEQLTEPTLIYCNGPGRAETVSSWLVDAELSKGGPLAFGAADWLSTNYHPDWRAVAGLRGGIGVHHGRLPRSIGQFMVRAFNSGEIRFLVCTSTLIEGVNTAAKNIVVLDGTIGGNKQQLDRFTFNNIRGRSGRMFRHVTGKVFLFHDEPEGGLPAVDIPILSQPADASPDILLGLEEVEMSDRSRSKLQKEISESPIDADTFREIPAVSINDQIAIANALQAMTSEQLRAFSWRSAFPQWDDQMAIFSLLWQSVFGDLRAHKFGVASPKQLVNWLQQSSSGFKTRALVESQINFDRRSKPQQVILRVLQFQRTGIGFEIPKWIHAIDTIQRKILSSRGIPPGDYQAFAARVEAGFMPQPLVALDEYGLPPELAAKLKGQLLDGDDDNLDSVLTRVAGLDLARLALSPFESHLLEEVQAGLSG